MAGAEAGGLVLLDSLSSKNKRICIETLVRIFKNVESKPDEEKFRTLKKSNKRFYDEVWQHEGARLILFSAGWEERGDLVILPRGISVNETLNELLENRLVKPNEDEWVEETKHVVANPQKLREEELRKKALQDKEKEMARLKKDMAERKAIAQRIVQEHRNDQEEKRISKASVARPRGEGGSAKMGDFKARQGG